MKSKPTTPNGSTAAEEAVNQDQNLSADVVQSIEDKIQYYQRKQEFINRFHSLEQSRDILNEHLGNLHKESGEDVFLSDQYRLGLLVKPQYGAEREVLNFRNPEILGEIVKFVLTKISAKMDETAREIAA